jgi:hypothetical protein
LLEILGHCHDHKADTGSKADGQGKIYFCRRVCLQPASAGQHSEQEARSAFISNTSLPLTLMDGLGFTIFAIGYLGKGTVG